MGEGAAMQAVASEAGEKQPALQSLVAALGSAEVVRRAAGESWLAAWWQAGAAVVGYGRREDRGERDLGENGSGGR
jgi:hypothetical protein